MREDKWQSLSSVAAPIIAALHPQPEVSELRSREEGQRKLCPTGHDMITKEDICPHCGQPLSFR